MTDAKRGEAAYKENLARIAERNAQAKKAGKQQREEYERGQSERRRASEARERAALPVRPGR